MVFLSCPKSAENPFKKVWTQVKHLIWVDEDQDLHVRRKTRPDQDPTSLRPVHTSHLNTFTKSTTYNHKTEGFVGILV